MPLTRTPGIPDATPTDGASAMQPELAALIRQNEQLLAERRAAELVRDEYIDLYERAPLAALTLGTGYSIHRVNRAMVALLGADQNECLKRGLRSFVLPEDRPALSAHLAKAEEGAVERCQLQLVPAEGVPILVELWTSAFPSTGLYQIRVVDLREQQRTALETDRLVQSERAARTANAAKDTFIAMLSHELRTPLTPVLAAASHFRAGNLGKDVTRAFAMIERNILAEVRMIDDLLDVNRVMRGKMSVSCLPTSVHDIVREAAEMQRADAVLKDLTLELDLGAGRQHANVDPLRLRQVFWNLVRNAIKFTSEGGRISIRSWNNREKLAIEVEDDGIGIAAEDLERLFSPFDQLSPRVGVSGGLGLGLAISRGLLELQGGTLAAQSNGPGRGSRFVVELVSVPAHDLSSPQASSAFAAPISVSPSSAVRILLIEDDLDTSEIMTEVLESEGFVVHVARSAKAAKNVNLDEVDVIVSDLGLPDGSGLDLIRELQVPVRRPAIALSGFGMEADVLASKQAGFDVHLTKPIDVQILLRMLRDIAASSTIATPVTGTPDA